MTGNQGRDERQPEQDHPYAILDSEVYCSKLVLWTSER